MLKEVTLLQISLRNPQLMLIFSKHLHNHLNDHKKTWKILQQLQQILKVQIILNNNQGKQHRFNSSGNHSKTSEYLAFNLVRWQDKFSRFSGHMLFLEKCIKENVIR